MMTREQAIIKSIEDYTRNSRMTYSEFARRCDISRAYINKIINGERGQKISYIYLSKIAKGMNMEFEEYQKLLEQYINGEIVENKISEDKIIINEILDILQTIDEKDLLLVHAFVSKLKN